MANIFYIDPADRSIYFLSQIFGSVGNVLPGTLNVFMSSMFLAINTIALTVGSIIVIYTTVVGLMMTAHEGEFLGKKWSGLWVPIRMVAGVVSLFPAASGYSLIQVIIMWIIVQGVGAADTLWTAAVKSAGGSAVIMPSDFAKAGVSTALIGVETQMKSLYLALVCEQTYAMPPVSNVPPEIAFRKWPAKDSGNIDGNSSVYDIGPDGVCGTMKKCNLSDKDIASDENKLQLCNFQNLLLQNAVNVLRASAKAFVNADRQYIDFYYNANKTIEPPTKDWISNYCEKKGLIIATSEATCCVPSTNIPTNVCKPNTLPPDTNRNFPKPVGDGPKVSNGMPTGSDSELSWAQTWSILPYLLNPESPSENPVDLNTLTLDQLKKIDIISDQANYYSKVLTDLAAKLTKPIVQDTDKFNPDEAVKQGWITAGAYFYQLVNLATRSISASMMPLSISLPNKEIMESKYRSNYLAASDFVDAISKAVASSGGGGGGGGDTTSGTGSNQSYSIPGGEALEAPLRSMSGRLTESFMQMLQGAAAANPGIHDTPLLRIATFGQNLLIIAQVFYVIIMLVAAIIAGVAASFETMIVGSGNLTSLLEVWKSVNSLLMPALYLLLGALMTMGALLGMYVPMIPFVVFTASVIGWFIASIEAMVAAPIVALGILSPGGQSEVFGRAEPSVMIIFNLFLRPTLMVFGLLVASFLANVVVKFVCMGFMYIMWDVMTLAPGLVEELIFIAIFSSIIFTSMNQVFTLIHHIPERILTYIGGQAMQFGEAQAAQAMKQAVEHAAGGAAQAGKGSAEGATKVGMKKAKKGYKGGGQAGLKNENADG